MRLKEGVISGRTRLVLLSFLLLFVELALIRWLGANVVYLSYFTNFVLLGCFLGIGIGFLRAQSRSDLFAFSPLFLTLLVLFIMAFPVSVACGGSQIIYFGCAPNGLPIWAILPAIFFLVALVMASLGQGVARAFKTFEPLEAYRLDILGSLLGTVSFSLLSFLGAPPVVWGSVAAAVFFAVHSPSYRLLQRVALAGMVILLGINSLNPADSWSPYYKISVFPIRPGIEALNVNGIPHQIILSMAKRREYEPLYFHPYNYLHGNPLRNLLIVGGGNGADVAVALAAGAKHIDVVEIDPRIYQIGSRMNPDRPYQDPRVTIHINDGRAFLEKTHDTYDLILFALPDSLVLVSGQSSLRLESYLFTREAMEAARRHLNSGGAFGMYNYYREDWLADRLAHTLEVVYGHRPCIDSTSGVDGKLSLFLVGSDAGNVVCPAVWAPGSQAVPAPADDDHPFLYLRTSSIPTLYQMAIVAILLVSFLAIRLSSESLSGMNKNLDLFFMGAAFLLLETKSVVQFALLFGTTWFVNALVFCGVLLSILAAIEVARRTSERNPQMLYLALFAALFVAWLVPPERLLALETPVRFLVAAVLTFAPIFVANLIFADRFRETDSSTVAFGANLLGAMVGGVLEYSSLLVGYRALIPILAVLYGLAFLWSRRSAPVAAFKSSLGACDV